MSTVLVAKMNALVEFDGRRVVIKKGITTAREGHEIVTQHPNLWEPQTVQFELKAEPVKESTPAPVEVATAAPGERRTVGTSAAPSRRGRRTAKGDGA